MKYDIETESCHRLIISFNTTEGLNKFTEFLSRNNIKGLGGDKSSKNVSYVGFFNEEEMNKIKENYPV